jgi:chromosome segregation ATPase
MQMKKIFKLNGNLITVLLFVVIYGFASNPQFSLAEISADSYCQLTVQCMQKEISNLQELIALTNQYIGDPQTLARQEEIKRVEFDQKKTALFSSFGTTAEEYVLYMGVHKQEVNKYLEDNPGVKQQIESLSAQINSLIDEYEALKESIEPPAPPLP